MKCNKTKRSKQNAILFLFMSFQANTSDCNANHFEKDLPVNHRQVLLKIQWTVDEIGNIF